MTPNNLARALSQSMALQQKMTLLNAIAPGWDHTELVPLAWDIHHGNLLAAADQLIYEYSFGARTVEQ